MTIQEEHLAIKETIRDLVMTIITKDTTKIIRDRISKDIHNNSSTTMIQTIMREIREMHNIQTNANLILQMLIIIITKTTTRNKDLLISIAKKNGISDLLPTNEHQWGVTDMKRISTNMGNQSCPCGMTISLKIRVPRSSNWVESSKGILSIKILQVAH